MIGNAVVQRFRFNNLAVGAVGAVATVGVVVTVAAPVSLVVGTVGFAIPSDAAFTGGLVGIIPARVTAVNQITLSFANASAGPLDPADTFDYEVFLFPAVGNVQVV